MATYICNYCNYKTQKEKKPENCDYCSKDGGITEIESVEELLKKRIRLPF